MGLQVHVIPELGKLKVTEIEKAIATSEANSPF